MIDFRYHLVSIIAVFLALAVGLVVGATALAPKTEAALSRLQTELSRTNKNVSKENAALKNQVSADQIFGSAAAPRLLPGLLTGEDVVLVLAPGAAGAVTTGVTAALHQAGAAVTGEINLSSNFLDTGGQNEDTLVQLAQTLAVTAGVTLPTRSDSPVGGQQDAAQVLAAALLSRSATSLTAGNRQQILTAFSHAGFLSIGSGASTVPPALAGGAGHARHSGSADRQPGHGGHGPRAPQGQRRNRDGGRGQLDWQRQHDQRRGQCRPGIDRRQR